MRKKAKRRKPEQSCWRLLSDDVREIKERLDHIEGPRRNSDVENTRALMARVDGIQNRQSQLDNRAEEALEAARSAKKSVSDMSMKFVAETKAFAEKWESRFANLSASLEDLGKRVDKMKAEREVVAERSAASVNGSPFVHFHVERPFPCGGRTRRGRCEASGRRDGAHQDGQ